ncbi:hypothetical protein K458DRAFT_386950 [Lentithecium fluviatile CBS 122367]|uniref:Uncharacterized protein n=1 Tax=Lentithecium fluviatile CBS 122367 TaxID=1168545 RepID=A0A6G1J8Y9_9PLEO|nr:hypothetical protein K458DRAFT_386950 [Lentithecium fluviatile CBS 122367]
MQLTTILTLTLTGLALGTPTSDIAARGKDPKVVGEVYNGDRSETVDLVIIGACVEFTEGPAQKAHFCQDYRRRFFRESNCKNLVGGEEELKGSNTTTFLLRTPEWSWMPLADTALSATCWRG